MRSATTFILLAAVLGLGSYIYVVERKLDQQDRRQEKARRALRFDPDQVSGLRLSTSDLQLALEKKDTDWRMVQPFQARADAGEVAGILDELEMLVRSDVITGREQRKQNLTPSDFGFAQPRARITLRENGQELTLLIGRDAPLGGTMFLKLESEQSIFAASTNLWNVLPRSPSDLRERQVFLGPPAEFARLEIRQPDGLTQLTRTDQGAWRLQKPVVGRAAYATIQSILNSLMEVRAVDFVAESIAASSLYGLDEPQAQITLAGSRAYGDQVLRIGRSVEGRTNELYAAQEGSESIFTISSDLLPALEFNATDLRDRRLITLSAYDIGYIRTTEGERNIALVRDDKGDWTVREPRQFTADGNKVLALLAEWTGLRIESFIENSGTNLVAWGLDKPVRQITFARKEPASSDRKAATTAQEDDSVTVLVARSEKSSQDLILVKLANEETLYEIKRDALATLPMQPLFYRDPVALAINPDEIRRLTLTTASGEQTVERASATNSFQASSAVKVDDAAIARTLAALKQVNAIDYVAEEPESLDMWGLATPRATLTIGLSGQGALGKSVILGEDAGPGSVFAMVRGQGLVFTLSKELRDQLLTPLYVKNLENEPLAEPSPSPTPPSDVDAGY